MTSSLRRLAPAALFALAAAATGAEAQVVYSGPVNRTIPANGYGLYQNVINGTFFTGPGAPSCPSGPGCNYDFNLFGGSSITTFSPPSGAGETSPSQPAERGFVAATAVGLPIVLGQGTMIGSMSIFNTGGSGTGNFVGGSDLIFGFRFRNETGGANTLHYGWARISLPASGNGTLVDYAYDATAGRAIAAGDVGGTVTPPPSVVPEPSTYALVAAGIAGVGAMARRRRTA